MVCQQLKITLEGFKMSQDTTGQIDNVMHENRLFEPSDEFRSKATIKTLDQYQQLYDEAKADLVGFWSKLANEELHWFKPFEKAFERDENEVQNVKWFVGGQTNVSYNCLDANIESGKGDKTAIIWESEPGEVLTLTYRELHTQVCKFANVLKSQGV